MAFSKRFRALRKRLSELRNHLLPKTFSPTGGYSERAQDQARGYRLLVHAEIEAYLEDVCRTVVTERIRVWKRDRTPSNLLLAFLACYHSGWIEYDDEHTLRVIELAKSRKAIKDAVEEIIDQAQQQFIQHLRDNHGVRRRNLKQLILPTGIDIADLDATWVTDLDDFGKRRGDVAHNAKGAAGGINPQDEFKRVTDLTMGLEELDKRLVRAR